MAGAAISALLMPVTILLTSVAVGLGWLDETKLVDLLRKPLVRVYLVVLISLSLFHAAHRLRFVAVDLLRVRGPVLSAACYGSAILGTVLAVVLMFRV
jgi:fumarate reductase subunit D